MLCNRPEVLCNRPAVLCNKTGYEITMYVYCCSIEVRPSIDGNKVG